MDEPERVRAYAAADFAEVNAAFVEGVLSEARRIDEWRILDVGCGPGDITTLLADRMTTACVVGVDGSEPMLRIARAEVATKAHFVRADAAELPFAPRQFEAVVSNSILHHVRDPDAFWREMLRVAAPGALVFHRDLARPGDAEVARAIVDAYAANEHAYLREDFYHSLLAAYTPEEVGAQLSRAGVFDATVTRVTDRHLDICFRKQPV